jgi:site-specific DNA recombinase
MPTSPAPARTRQAVAYRRVSTQAQAGERHSSLPEQEAHVRDYCATRGIVQVLSFTDVASGRRDDRAEYRRMVKFVLDGGADTVVVQWLDRFGRNAREILRRIWQLQEAGVDVVATDEDIREELMLLIKAGFAGQESRRNGERVRSKMTSAARKGVHFGRAPYGYRRVRQGETITFEQNEAEVLAIRQMVRLIVDENLGYKSVADRLSAGGFPSRHGRPWAADTVRKILASESLVGTLTYNIRPSKANIDAELVRVPGFFSPPILAADEWAALRRRLAIRREHPRGRTAASDYLLSGIARCGHCGGPMVGKRSYSRRKSEDKYRLYRNYWCSAAQRGRGRCAFYNGHAARKLEAAILEHLGRYADPRRVQELLASTPQPGSSARADLERVERRLAELDRDFLSNLDLLKRGILDEQDFARANAARKNERGDLEQRHQQLAAEAKAAASHSAALVSLPERVRSFLDDLESLETRKAKADLQTILLAAHVWRDGRIELEFRTDTSS